jgi:transmembrane sensor
MFGGAGAAAAAAGVVAFMMLGREQILQTAPGEQKRVRLSDGTSVLLNTDSRLRVKLSGSERRLYLDRGQAYFQVAKDKARPFRVFVGHDEVRALGTAFEVRRLGDSVQVTLEEGRVAIYRAGIVRPETFGPTPGSNVVSGPAVLAGTAEPLAILSPGQQAVLASAQPVAVREIELRKVQAWRYGRMILDDAPLADTVADLNRYGGVQIVLADPKLADIRVSGVFHTGRPDDFVKSVTAAFPVEIAREDDQTIVLRAR